jgi:hypothetical protein
MTNPEDGAAPLVGAAAAAANAPNKAEPAEGKAELTEGTAPVDSHREPLAESLRAQVARLDELDELPVEEHIERYEAVHDELNAALRGIHDPGG